jgi:hypothetical protein
VQVHIGKQKVVDNPAETSHPGAVEIPLVFIFISCRATSATTAATSLPRGRLPHQVRQWGLRLVLGPIRCFRVRE